MQPRTRQELYEQIRNFGGKDAFVLEEMIRLGFWQTGNGLPNDPTDEIRRIGEINKELDDLRAENRKLHNEQALLKELRKRRLAESREKQKQTKERRKLERAEKAEKWKKRQTEEILYLGEDVSKGLNRFETNAERLQQHNLPNFPTVESLAKAMGLTVNKLRFLAYDRKTSEVTHYVHFKMKKKSGGFRLISAPMPELKEAQLWILENILAKINVHQAAHGFLPEKNIVSNAKPHLGAKVIVNVDLKDFFPSISYRRVKGMFQTYGFSEAISSIFALLCTAPTVEEVEIDNKTYFVAIGERHLPQGSPASPMVSNIIAKRLDKGLSKIAENLGFRYTRYADDLTFSSENKEAEVPKLLGRLRYIVDAQGFTVNEEKTRILRSGRQQEVTGVVVNEKLSIDRKELRKFRAVLHQAENKGLEGLNWGNSPDLIASLKGYANFVFMVDKQKGYVFQQQVRRIAEKYDWKPLPPRFVAKPKVEKTDKSEKPWWKLW
jgi:retron-type reverse transcriptase